MNPKSNVCILGILVLCLAAALACPSPASAEPGEKTWDIPAFGLYRIPAELTVAHLPDVMKLLEQQKEALAPAVSDGIARLAPTGLPSGLPFTMGFYQLTHFDGRDYRQAYLLSLRLHEPVPEVTAHFRGLPDENKKAFAQSVWRQVRDSLSGFSYMEPATRTGGKILEISPEKIFATAAGHTAYAGGIRYLIQYQDFFAPFVVRGYAAADPAGAPHLLLMIVTDSERTFWQKMMDGILSRPVDRL